MTWFTYLGCIYYTGGPATAAASAAAAVTARFFFLLLPSMGTGWLVLSHWPLKALMSQFCSSARGRGQVSVGLNLFCGSIILE